MTNKQEIENADLKLSRRSAFAGICFAMLSQKALAAIGPESAVAASPAADPKATFTKDSEVGMIETTGIHRGKGKVKTKFFRFDDAPAPAHFIVYDLPPGASEGVHVHFLDDRNKEGSFDEYYYFISGQGQMEIDGEIVAVAKGDHIHTPLEVEHGVENTHPTENLRVFLTFIKRGNEPAQMRRSALGPPQSLLTHRG
jgi:oxalate decarboxylase/phosphoglucose isomerase-like protein (cupin superfamily)